MGRAIDACGDFVVTQETTELTLSLGIGGQCFVGPPLIGNQVDKHLAGWLERPVLSPQCGGGLPVHLFPETPLDNRHEIGVTERGNHHVAVIVGLQLFVVARLDVKLAQLQTRGDLGKFVVDLAAALPAASAT